MFPFGAAEDYFSPRCKSAEEISMSSGYWKLGVPKPEEPELLDELPPDARSGSEYPQGHSPDLGPASWVIGGCNLGPDSTNLSCTAFHKGLAQNSELAESGCTLDLEY